MLTPNNDRRDHFYKKFATLISYLLLNVGFFYYWQYGRKNSKTSNKKWMIFLVFYFINYILFLLLHYLEYLKCKKKIFKKINPALQFRVAILAPKQIFMKVSVKFVLFLSTFWIGLFYKILATLARLALLSLISRKT